MAGYTSEEVQSTIDSFLLGAVSTPATSLNVRNTLSARDDIYALLTTTLLMRPDSYFYVILLAKNRLEALRRQQLSDLNFLLSPTTSDALARRGQPVTSTTELVNAQAALLNINAAVNTVAGPQTRNLGPEVERFRASVSSFASKQLARNVVVNGAVVETAGETRDKISTVWPGVLARHQEILTLSTAIKDALTNLGLAQLPQKAIQEIVRRLESRIGELTTQLEQDTSVSTHREALLELLSMRTLLSRISSFRSPQQLIAPQAQDGTQVTGVSGTTPPSIQGTVSGPFNIAPLSQLRLESGTPVVTSTIPIPGYSNAETRSAPITYPLTFPVGASLRLLVDGTLYPAQSYSAAVYASQPAFLSSIQSYLTANAIPATAYAVGSQIYIRSDSEADTSSVQVQASTAGQQAFLLLTGFQQTAVCRPLSASALAQAAVVFPAVRLTERKTEYGNFSGTTLAAGALTLEKASGFLNTSAGGNEFVAQVNLEVRGVRQGDSISVGTQVATITAVFGAKLRLSTDIVAPNIGPAVFFRIGFDFTNTPVGTRVLVTSLQIPLNSGPYRLVSGTVGRITVDRPFAANFDSVTAYIAGSYVDVGVLSATTADGITAWPASAGATALGLPVSPTQVRVSFTTLSASGVDFLNRGVRAGDTVSLATTPPATVTVASATVDTLQVSPAVPYFSGGVTYSIESTSYLAWLSLSAVVDTFISTADIATADFAITRLLAGASPSALLSSGGPIGQYQTSIVNLAAIQNYAVPFERGIDNILKMLTEQGFDRSADLFTTLQIVEFFGMHPDGSSYATHLMRTASDVTRQVAPQSRFAKGRLNAAPEVRLLSRRRT